MAGLFLHCRFSDTLISSTHCDNLFQKRDDKVFVRLRHWRKLVSFRIIELEVIQVIILVFYFI